MKHLFYASASKFFTWMISFDHPCLAVGKWVLKRLSDWLVSGRPGIGAQVLSPEPILPTTFLDQPLPGCRSNCCIMAVSMPLLTQIGTSEAIPMGSTLGRWRPRPQRELSVLFQVTQEINSYWALGYPWWEPFVHQPTNTLPPTSL